MDTLEIIGGLIGFLVLPYAILTGRLSMRLGKIQERVDKVYTKGETKELIGLMTDPIKSNTEKLIAAQQSMIEALHRVELQLVTHEQQG